MPERFDLVGERPAAAAGAEETRDGLAVVLMVGVSGRDVKRDEVESRGVGLEKVLRAKPEGLQRPSSVSVFFRFDADSLNSIGSTFSESDKSSEACPRLSEGAEEGAIAETCQHEHQDLG
jgi:hypothetical protein